MKQPARGLTIAVLLTSLVSLQAAQPAAAAPISVKSDETDNRVAFTYDEDSGTLGDQSSFRRATERGVRFEVVITEADGYGTGLVGKLRLVLEDDRARIYDGWFELTVESRDSDDVVYIRTRPATVHLKPRPGQRKASLGFRFDLPSGSYEAWGSFESN